MELVIIKKYTFSAGAYLDATILNSNGIDCYVDGDNGASVIPYIPNQVTLSVPMEFEHQAKVFLENSNE